MDPLPISPLCRLRDGQLWLGGNTPKTFPAECLKSIYYSNLGKNKNCAEGKPWKKIKNSCTRDGQKKQTCKLKMSHPTYHFSNGPSLTVTSIPLYPLKSHILVSQCLTLLYVCEFYFILEFHTVVQERVLSVIWVVILSRVYGYWFVPTVLQISGKDRPVQGGDMRRAWRNIVSMWVLTIVVQFGGHFVQ